MNPKIIEISSVPTTDWIWLLAKKLDSKVEIIDNSFARINIKNEFSEGVITSGISTSSFLSNSSPIAWIRIDMTAHQEVRLHYLPDVSDSFFRVTFFESNQSVLDIHANTPHSLRTGVNLNTSGCEHQVLMPAHTQGTSTILVFAKDWVKNQLILGQSPLMDKLVNNSHPIVMYDVIDFSTSQFYKAFIDNRLEGFIDKIKCSVQIAGLMAGVFEQLLRNRKSIPQTKIRVPDIEAIRRAEQMLVKEIDKSPSISELATEVGMSETKFKTLFKQLYGRSVYDYYLHFKMSVAHRWILENKMNVTEIGAILGYKNLSHFSRIFKKHYGEFPSRYSGN